MKGITITGNRFFTLVLLSALCIVFSLAQPVKAEDTICGNATVTALLAGQYIDSGDVMAWNDAENLYVRITTTDDYYLTETHLAVALSPDEIPQTKTGNPKVGLFPYQMTYDPPVAEVTYTISLAGSGYDEGDTLYIAAHAVVQLLDESGEVIREETGWADGEDFPGRNWATYFTYTVQPCALLAIGIEADKSVINIPSTFPAISVPVQYTINFETSSSDTYNISLVQSFSPATGCASLSTDYPSGGWTTDTTASWTVNETITCYINGTYELSATATIEETGESEQVIITVIAGSGPS